MTHWTSRITQVTGQAQIPAHLTRVRGALEARQSLRKPVQGPRCRAWDRATDRHLLNIILNQLINSIHVDTY